MFPLHKRIAKLHYAKGASFNKCMGDKCSNPPERECLWAEGRGRAWHCQKCHDKWVKENEDSKGEEGWLPVSIVKERKIPNGIVGEKYGEYPEVKKAKTTGDKEWGGEDVGLFILLPARLAKKFPDLGDEDTSPSHVTFLYIGKVKDRKEQEHLIKTLREVNGKWWPEVTAKLDGLDHFDQPDKDRRVAYVKVNFDKDLSGMRLRVKQALQDGGIKVDDSFPEYKPHTTLAYMPGIDSPDYDGEVPEGTWKFKGMEVWGLPKVHRIKFGPSFYKVSDLWLQKRLWETAKRLNQGQGRTAGWWGIKDIGDADLVTGDYAADFTGDYLNQLDLIYRTSLGRPVKPEEIVGTFLFSFRPVRSGDIRLNRWFDKFVTWLGVPGDKITWSLDVWDKISWFFLQLKNRTFINQSPSNPIGKPPPPLPDIWETLDVVKADLIRLNELEYPGDTATGTQFRQVVLDKLSVLQDYWSEIMFPENQDDAEQSLVERIGDKWLQKKAIWAVSAGAHDRSIALLKWLSAATKKLGVGRDTYVVGGAVRNFIIDQPIKDLDIVIDTIAAGKDSDWLADKLSRMIPGPTNVTTNQYGVAILTVKGNWDLDGEDMKGEVIEIANARKESYGGAGGKGYKPSEVEPATIKEDLYRREFTFNSLLWRLSDLASGPEKAEIIDLTGCGMRDLKEGILACPSDPDKTFSDDPTRILRAIKFTGKYGFKIPPDLAKAIKRNAPKMKRMPWEAIGKILVDNILKEPTARKSLKQMKDLGILDVVSEMIQSTPPFKTYMAGQFNKNRNVAFLLDMMDLGIPSNTPLTGLKLDAKDMRRFREITIGMDEKDASKFLDALIKPSIDNRKVFETLNLQGPERSKMKPTAQALLLQDPSLANNPRKLTDGVIKALR